LVAEILGISRTSLYDWLRWYRADGEAALDSRASPGAVRVITPEMDRWLKETLAHSMPTDHGYSATKWTIKIVADLLKKRFAIAVGNSTVGLHLHQCT
jgi:transposase